MKCNRLSKVLAQAGVASRRACERLIVQGRVLVNGAPASKPEMQVLLGKDQIVVDGKQISQVEAKVYYMLNKPAGYLCSHSRGSRRQKLVLDLFAGETRRLFTVGRLDKETQGLLLVTNDGHFAHRLIHPSSGIAKEYLAKTGQEITIEHLEKISAGCWIEGTFVRPLKVKKVRRGTLRLLIAEGKKHEVRLLLAGAGLVTRELTRIRIGQLSLHGLPVGYYRVLSDREKELLLS